jgi:hypothetical protein
VWLSTVKAYTGWWFYRVPKHGSCDGSCIAYEACIRREFAVRSSHVVQSTLYHEWVSKRSIVLAGTGFLRRIAVVLGDIIKSTLCTMWYVTENGKKKPRSCNEYGGTVPVLETSTWRIRQPQPQPYDSHASCPCGSQPTHDLLAPPRATDAVAYTGRVRR